MRRSDNETFDAVYVILSDFADRPGVIISCVPFIINPMKPSTFKIRTIGSTISSALENSDPWSA
jgi:hypothetical protein